MNLRVHCGFANRTRRAPIEEREIVDHLLLYVEQSLDVALKGLHTRSPIFCNKKLLEAVAPRTLCSRRKAFFLLEYRAVVLIARGPPHNVDVNVVLDLLHQEIERVALENLLVHGNKRFPSCALAATCSEQ